MIASDEDKVYCFIATEIVRKRRAGAELKKGLLLLKGPDGTFVLVSLTHGHYDHRRGKVKPRQGVYSILCHSW